MGTEMADGLPITAHDVTTRIEATPASGARPPTRSNRHASMMLLPPGKQCAIRFLVFRMPLGPLAGWRNSRLVSWRGSETGGIVPKKIGQPP